MESLENLRRLIMTQAQTNRFKTAIEKHRSELVSEIHSQKRQIVIAESEHDPIDQVQSMHVRENSATHLGRRSRILAEVDRSLQAISEGSYGICVDCEEPISLKTPGNHTLGVALSQLPGISGALRSRRAAGRLADCQTFSTSLMLGNRFGDANHVGRNI